MAPSSKASLAKAPWWTGLTQAQRINHGSPRCGDWSPVLVPLQVAMRATYLTWANPRIVAYCNRVFQQLHITDPPAPPEQHYAMPYPALEALLYSLLDAYNITGLQVAHVPPEERIDYVSQPPKKAEAASPNQRDAQHAVQQHAAQAHQPPADQARPK